MWVNHRGLLGRRRPQFSLLEGKLSVEPEQGVTTAGPGSGASARSVWGVEEAPGSGAGLLRKRGSGQVRGHPLPPWLQVSWALEVGLWLEGLERGARPALRGVNGGAGGLWAAGRILSSSCSDQSQAHPVALERTGLCHSPSDWGDVQSLPLVALV